VPACLFDTALGRCGIAWSAAGLRAVQLPSADDAATLARLALAARLRPPGALTDAIDPIDPIDAAGAPAGVAAAIEAIVGLLRGEPRDLREIVLDTVDTAAFALRVYAAAREIAPGATLGYGELACRIGEPGAARAVGRALGANPWVIVVPCHRVLAAGERPGGFSAPGGVATKRRLLEIESACRPPLMPGQSARLF
jgi:methylated-DNA-[protein]-cysteine S-methyltransferase